MASILTHPLSVFPFAIQKSESRNDAAPRWRKRSYPKMSDSEVTAAGSEAQPEHDPAHAAQEPEPKGTVPSGFSFSIWPPTQKTRDAVISRLIETLSTESVLSKRYGVVPGEEAAEAARRIEEEAFGVASGNANSTEAGVDDGIEILQMYSKEISKSMLQTVKARAESASVKEESGADVASSEPSAAGEAAAPEEASSPVKLEE